MGGRLRFRATGEQLLAGIHLFRGRVAQMDAGEGKDRRHRLRRRPSRRPGPPRPTWSPPTTTWRNATPRCWRRYTARWASAAAQWRPHTEEGERRHVYRRSIVYGAMRELGFDFLRDNLKYTARERVQQPLDAAIVDEGRPRPD